MKVQDIRSFFNKPKSGSGESSQGGSTSPALQSPEVVEVPTRRRKAGTSKKDEKRKNSKDTEDEDRPEENDSESDENPLPRSSRSKKSVKTDKRKQTRPLLSDESDGEDPLPKKVRDKASKTKSTERKRKAKVLTDSDDEADFDMKKSTNGKDKSSDKVKEVPLPVTNKKRREAEVQKKQQPKVAVNPADFFASGPIKRQKTEKVDPSAVPVQKLEVNLDKKEKSPTKVSTPDEKCGSITRSSSRSPTKKIPDSTAIETLREQTPTRRTSSREKGTPPFRRTLDFDSSPKKSSPKPKVEPSSSKKIEVTSEDEKKSKMTESPKKVKLTPEKHKEGKSSKKSSQKKEEFKVPTPQRKDTSKSKATKRAPKKSEAEEDDEDNFDPKSKPPPAKKRNKAKAPQTPGKTDDEQQPMKTPEEKKKVQQQNYSKYLAKANAKPKNLGMKEIPEGAPDCLQNMTFVITGVLDSLERDSCKDLVEQYGGRVTGSVSRKTTYLIVGDDPGESKTRKAAQLSIPQLTEDGLFDILRKSNPDGKFSTVAMPMDFDDVEAKKEQEEYDPDKSLFESGSKSKKDKNASSKKQTKDSPVKPVKLEIVKQEEPSTSSKSQVPVATTAKTEASQAGLMYVDKYKPKTLKQVVGQTKDTSNASKLVRWLRNWFNYHGKSQEKVKSAWPGLKDPEGKTFKCALLSGPPGIGKTTTAHLACKELGYEFFELNASDTRNKSGLKANVAGAITSNIIVLGHGSKDGVSRRHVLIMDEVDGMSGNEDRGGVQELIALIKTSKIPIICICNDRNHPKIRSLSNYCFDLRFSKPTIQELKGFVASICFKEKIKADQQKLTQMMISTDQDVRQILHQLQMLKDGKSEQVFNPKKDLRFGPWDVCRKVFSKPEHQSMTIHEKTGLFFQDYSFGPLFIQENYLKQVPAAAKGCKYRRLNLIHKSAAAIADGDLVDNLIRRTNNWGMLPVMAIFASHMPGEYMESNNIGPIDFPQWLGKNSNRNKRHRLLQSLHTHVHLQVSASLEALNMDYLPYLRRSIVTPLASFDHEKAAEKMEAYALLRDDLESINDLALWPGMKNPMDNVDSKTKAAFTRLVNKEILPYSNAKPIKAKGRAKTDDLQGHEDDDEEGADDEEEEEETVEKDAMVKMKARKASSSSKSRGSKKSENVDDEKPSTSKAKAKGGRSRK